MLKLTCSVAVVAVMLLLLTFCLEPALDVRIDVMVIMNGKGPAISDSFFVFFLTKGKNDRTDYYLLNSSI